MKKIAILSFLWFWPLFVYGSDSAIAAVFARHHVDGTIVIASLDGKTIFVHDKTRAQQAFSPASTFKVANTLIALQEGVVSDENSVFEWDGIVREIPNWNRNQTLESAFQASCVWCYQKIAQRIGVTRYAEYLSAMHYGQLSPFFDVTTFWLDGALQISATDQVDFLRRLYQHKLGFSSHSYATLKKIMLTDTTPSYALFAKTGWGTRVKPSVGWYVGYLEKSGEVWFFAMNMEISSEDQLPLRKTITLEALQAKDIL